MATIEISDEVIKLIAERYLNVWQKKEFQLLEMRRAVISQLMNIAVLYINRIYHDEASPVNPVGDLKPDDPV